MKYIIKEVRLPEGVLMRFELEKGYFPRLTINGLGIPPSPIDFSESSLQRIRDILSMDDDIQRGII
jgi:hypothetical protein